ncbi:MAG: PAS domain S-box protein [Bacteroidia bacterium]|nr:PAS domain S-box protein [Bacteroidia bacterium]
MKKRFLFLYLTTISVVFIISGFSLYLKYNDSVNDAKARIQISLDNRVSIIESIFHNNKDVEKTIHIIEESILYKETPVNRPVEYTYGYIENDSIHFLKGLKKVKNQKKFTLPIGSEKAIPMQLALSGKNGLVKSEDYMGDKVFAAYHYIPELKLGVVAKIEQSEINQSYLEIIIITIIIGLIMVLLSSFIISKITIRIDKELIASEEKYRKIFNNANDGIFLSDINGNYIDVNETACNMVGYSKAELITMNINQIISQSSIKKQAIKINDIKIGKSIVIEREFICKDGSFCNVEISGNMLPDGNILAIVRNIDERLKYEIKLKTQNEEIQTQNEEICQQNEEYRQLNEELFRSDERYRSLIAHLEAGVVVHSADTSIINNNQRASFLLGLSEEQMKGKLAIDPRWKFINENKLPLTLEEYPVNRVISTQKPFKEIILGVYRPESNDVVWLTVNGFPVFNELNQLTEAVISFIDITDRKISEIKLKEKSEEIETQNEEYKQINEEYKQINEELYLAKQRAEEGEKLKSAFLANMSHEIRTPMNGIVGFAELLNNPNLTVQKRKEFTSIIIERSNQLLSIVNDILDISKIEAGLVTVKNECVAINSLISELWVFYKNQIKLKEIHFDKKFGIDDLQACISVDRTKITQVLNNLLNNALKFTKQGHIILGYEIKDNMLEFYVEDTGIGISAENRDHIFERFRQVELELTKNYGGTGLGLSISKELIEMMGGKIWIESELGKGTKVFFTIPYLQLNNEPEFIPDSLQNTIEKDIEGKSILIVDDDDINMQYLKELVSILNIKVYEATNGLEAVEQFKNNRNISLVLMDLKMPIMNGIDATKLIKSLNSSTKVVAQTAYAMASEKEMALKEGCDDYISKPLNKAVLIDLIKKYL